MTDYTNTSQQRVLKLLKALTGHDLEGLTVTQLADMTDSTLSQVIRDLANLEIAGMAERDGERWRHGQAVTTMYRQFAVNFRNTLDKTLSQALKVLKDD